MYCFEKVSVFPKTPTRAGMLYSADGKTFVSVYSSTGCTINVPYRIHFSATADKEVIPQAPATLASAVNLIGVPQVAIAATSYGWLQVGGEAEAALTAATTAGHTLETLNAGVALATEGAATKTINSMAMAKDTTTAATTATVYLFGLPVEIAAS